MRGMNASASFLVFIVLRRRIVLPSGVTSKKATFHLSSEFPLNISSLCLISVIVKLALRDYTCSEISNDNITLSSIEFNKDYSNLRLDSANSITLSNYIEQFKIYPKKAGVRYEHKITQPLNAQDVISSLLNQGNALDFSTRLTNLEKEQEKTNSILSKVSKLPSLFNALLERLDKRPI